MKRFTPKRNYLYKLLLTVIIAIIYSSGNLFAQAAVSSSLGAVVRPIPPYNTSILLDRTGSNGDWNGGSGTYVWTSSPAVGVVFGAYTQSGGSAGDVTVTFSGAALPGDYTFTLTRGFAFNRTVTVRVGNIAAASGTGDISTFAVNTVNGNFIVPGDVDIFDPGVNTAALGVDVGGRFYFIPNDGTNGVMTLYGANVNGAGATQIDPSTDINGGNNNSLGFVRLAIRDDNTGYILAGDGTTLYLASFIANGTVATPVGGITTVSLSGGSMSEFNNGDICFSGSGTMFALANDGGGNTYIYTANPPYTTLSKRWTLVGPGGTPFTGAINGCAFDAAGSMYISGSSAGIFYIDQNTVNNFGVGTVVTTQKSTITGVTDLASNVYPLFTTLPVKLGAFTVTKQGSNGLLKWTTLNEINNDHFEIERSSDGVNFTQVGNVNGNGTTSTVNNYQFADPLAGITSKIVYYRLRDVGYDGRSTVSKIVALRLDGSGGPKNLTVYPNPFATNFKLNMQTDREEMITIRISNMAGQQVVSRTHLLQPGENIIVVKDLGALKPGLHIMEIITAEEKIVQKIIKY